MWTHHKRKCYYIAIVTRSLKYHKIYLERTDLFSIKDPLSFKTQFKIRSASLIWATCGKRWSCHMTWMMQVDRFYVLILLFGYCDWFIFVMWPALNVFVTKRAKKLNMYIDDNFAYLFCLKEHFTMMLNFDCNIFQISFPFLHVGGRVVKGLHKIRNSYKCKDYFVKRK